MGWTSTHRRPTYGDGDFVIVIAIIIIIGNRKILHIQVAVKNGSSRGAVRMQSRGEASNSA